MPREYSPEEIEEHAMRMAWAAVPEDAKASLLQMARASLEVLEQLMERMRFNQIVNPPEAT